MLNFKETKASYESKFESNEIAFSELERSLKNTSQRLAKRKEEYKNDAEKKQLLEELARAESYKRTRSL